MDTQTKAAQKQEGLMLITLAEIGHEVGGSRDTARSFAAEQGVTIYRDWEGNEAVTIADAGRLRFAWAERRAQLQADQEAQLRWAERMKAEHQARLQQEARQRRDAEERELETAREDHRRDLQARFAQQAAARAAARARVEPDTSVEAWRRAGSPRE